MSTAAAPAKGLERRPTGSAAYELFILALQILSLVNLAIAFLPNISDNARGVVLTVDAGLTIIFLPDFFYRLRKAPDRREYFLRRGGWLDLVGSMPFPGLRLFRTYRVVQQLRALHAAGGRAVVRDILANAPQSALLSLLLLALVTLEVAAILVLIVEEDATGSNITTSSDALWWGWVTMTTVGYGDVYPVTNPGRVVGVCMMTLGVALFGTFTGFLANEFVNRHRRRVARAEGTGIEALRALLIDHERLLTDMRSRLEALANEIGKPPAK